MAFKVGDIINPKSNTNEFIVLRREFDQYLLRHIKDGDVYRQGINYVEENYEYSSNKTIKYPECIYYSAFTDKLLLVGFNDKGLYYSLDGNYHTYMPNIPENLNILYELIGYL